MQSEIFLLAVGGNNLFVFVLSFSLLSFCFFARMGWPLSCRHLLLSLWPEQLSGDSKTLQQIYVGFALCGSTAILNSPLPPANSFYIFSLCKMQISFVLLESGLGFAACAHKSLQSPVPCGVLSPVVLATTRIVLCEHKCLRVTSSW